MHPSAQANESARVVFSVPALSLFHITGRASPMRTDSREMARESVANEHSNGSGHVEKVPIIFSDFNKLNKKSKKF